MKPLRVLMVEDSEDDAVLLLRELRRGGFEPAFERVDTAEAMNEALDRETWDVIISDYSMPKFSGFEAMVLFKKKGLELPFIIVSGTIGEDTAVEMMKAGAHDYIMKNNLSRLVPAMERELRDAETRREKKKVELELKKLSAAIENSVNLVFITDLNGAIEYVNPIFESVTGYTKKEIIGQTPRIFASGDTPKVVYKELWKTVLAGKTWNGTFKNRKKTGQNYWVNTVISPIKDEMGDITNFLSVQEDITQRMRTEERLKYFKSHDEVTDLLNRTRFIELVDNWIPSARAKKIIGAFLLIDIDDFQSINDAYGQLVGDRLLKSVSQVIKKAINSEESMLARLGSDEFVAFLPKRDKKGGQGVAEKIRRAVEDFQFKEISTDITVSTGISLYPPHGDGALDLLRTADAALYRARELGQNKCRLYSPEDRYLEEMNSKLASKALIQKALKDDGFRPWFQPILCLKDDTIHHCEALVRMYAEDGKILQPGMFINVAEKTGFIGAIDRVVIEKTMVCQTEINRSRDKPLSFAMNLSGRDLGDEELLSFVKSKISETGADPKRLIFEVTETEAIRDLEGAVKFIEALKALGCQFALDDFGVGFTSFTYLKDMNVDYIKIDGSFIRRLHENPKDQLFVKAMIDVARGMGIQTIAEFVESEKTLKLLKEFKVDYAQGYYIGKPAPTLP